MWLEISVQIKDLEMRKLEKNRDICGLGSRSRHRDCTSHEDDWSPVKINFAVQSCFHYFSALAIWLEMLTTLLQLSEDGQATNAVPVRGVIAWWIAMESLNFAEQLMTTRRDSWPGHKLLRSCLWLRIINWWFRQQSRAAREHTNVGQRQQQRWAILIWKRKCGCTGSSSDCWMHCCSNSRLCKTNHWNVLPIGQTGDFPVIAE